LQNSIKKCIINSRAIQLFRNLIKKLHIEKIQPLGVGSTSGFDCHFHSK